MFSILKYFYIFKRLIPGPPFLFGAILALTGLIITFLIPSKNLFPNKSETVHHKHNAGNNHLLSYENEALIETGDPNGSSENSNSCKKNREIN